VAPLGGVNSYATIVRFCRRKYAGVSQNTNKLPLNVKKEFPVDLIPKKTENMF